MSRKNIKEPTLAPERAREIAAARAEILRLAKQQGVQPFDFDEAIGDAAAGQSQAEIQQEVDAFLQMLREWRDLPATRSIE